MSDQHHLLSPTSAGVVDNVRSLSSSFGQLLVSQENTDIVLLTGRTRHNVHKIILASQSDYFRAMLYGGLKESLPGTTEVVLPDTPSVAFHYLLKYIYTGCINLALIKEEEVFDILGLAHRFVFTELEAAVCDYLRTKLSMRNVCAIYDLANVYSLQSLSCVCKEFMDRNASSILASPAFISLSGGSVSDLLQRDSFFADEVDIFRAAVRWCEQNPDVDHSVTLSAVRLPLIPIATLLSSVRGSRLVSPDTILDAITMQTKICNTELQYRGSLLVDENVATERAGAVVMRGEMKATLLDGDVTNYDLDHGFTRHAIDDNNPLGILIKLGQPFIINSIKLLLWDRDMRSYSYYVEVSVDDVDYDCVVDHTPYLCRSWQCLYFPARVVRYVRVVGTHNTINRVFHLVHVECLFTKKQFHLQRGLVVPAGNVATVAGCACVVEGVSRTRNALINGETSRYDWDSGYTCHQLSSGAIVVQLAQPYMVSSVRLLLWDCDDRCYCFYVEVSADQQVWHRVVDMTNSPCKSWQTFLFEATPVTFIRIVGTNNTANEVFHCVHVECPADCSAVPADLETTRDLGRGAVDLDAVSNTGQGAVDYHDNSDDVTQNSTAYRADSSPHFLYQTTQSAHAGCAGRLQMLSIDGIFDITQGVSYMDSLGEELLAEGQHIQPLPSFRSDHGASMEMVGGQGMAASPQFVPGIDVYARPPEYQHDAPESQHDSPEYQHGTPEYQHDTPEYQHDTPEYQHGTPEYQHGTPEYQHGTPEYQHGTPEYQHGTPEYQHDSPEYQHGTPEYQRDSPEYQHGTPECQHDTPEADRTDGIM